VGNSANHRNAPAYNQTSSPAPSSRALTALILAYQASLSRLLHNRRLSKSQWASFSSFLDAKETEITALAQSLSRTSVEGTPAPLPRGYEEDVLRKWRNNWLGDPRWLDILLKGDPEFTRDQFFELPFEKALTKHYHFKNGLIGPKSGDVSLKALEKQVQEQRMRLGELRQLRREALRASSIMRTSSPVKPAAEADEQTEKKEHKVIFEQHQVSILLHLCTRASR
jgi:hypothetical protein